MLISDNPFCVLQASIFDTKTVINEKADDLAFEDADNEERYEKARNILMNPQKRIAAEMRWFVGCTKQQEDKIISRLKDKSLYADDINFPLAKLNFLIYSLTYERPNNFATAIEQIDLLYSQQDADTILERLNAARKISKFPMIQGTDKINAELVNLRDDIRQSINAVVKTLSHDEYISTANNLTDKNFGVVVEDFFATYDLDMNPQFPKYATQIMELLDKILDDAKSSDIDALETALTNYAMAIKPLNLRAMAVGTNDFGDTEAAFEAVRSVSIILFNEKSLIDEPLRISKMLSDCFGYIPNLAKTIDADIEVLESQQQNQPTPIFVESKNALDNILDAMKNELHFEKGFEASNLKFYAYDFKLGHEKSLMNVFKQSGYKADESRLLNFMAALIYRKLGIALTWTDESPQTVLELFNKALFHAKFSYDDKVIATLNADITEMNDIVRQIETVRASPKVQARNSGCMTLCIVPALIIFGIWILYF